MPGPKFLKSLIVFLVFTAHLVFSEEVTLTPIDDISIANKEAVEYDIPGVNKGSHECLALVNYKC